MKEKAKFVLLTKISRVLVTIILLLVLTNTVISIYNFKLVTDKKEPVFFTETIQEENKVVYRQCLFNIIKQKITDTQSQNQEVRIVLRPFFLT